MQFEYPNPPKHDLNFNVFRFTMIIFFSNPQAKHTLLYLFP